ncbi:MAG TPA: hypothetical protein VFL47_11885, partial [Flavisolibacter sp.]|nr:hypothetical protein [Flavisolibacter sp.]
MKCKTIYVRFAIGFACLFVFAPSFLFGQTSTERNYIFTKWQQSKWTPDAKTLETWRSQQKSTLYRKMAALPDSIKTKLTARAQQALSYTWPALRASNYLEFKNTGNRSNFEAVQKERRTALCNLVMGYLVSGDKKYLPSIVDGLWATLEESTWVLPAHVGAQKAGTNLPDPTEEIVDLVNGETAASVAAIQLLMKDELGQTSPIINQRIHYELNKRIVVPYLQRTDFWWMGFGQRIPNNWNPWINANVLTVMLYTAQNADTVNLVLNKLCKSVDKFVNGYGDDGACDEGPSYWSEAGGKLIQFLQLLKSVSAGRLDVSDKELLHNIGTYIYKTHISGSYVVNFADATPRAIPEPNAVYAFGDYFNDDTLKRFAAYLSSLQPNNFSLSNVNNFLHGVDVFQELYTTQKQEALPAVSWLPSTQVLTVRSKAGSSKGLFVAVQGGHNDE